MIVKLCFIIIFILPKVENPWYEYGFVLSDLIVLEPGISGIYGQSKTQPSCSYRAFHGFGQAKFVYCGLVFVSNQFYTILILWELGYIWHAVFSTSKKLSSFSYNSLPLTRRPCPPLPSSHQLSSYKWETKWDKQKKRKMLKILLKR